MKEIWKDCIGFEGVYQVSSLDRVRSLTRIVKRKDGRTAKIRGRILTLHVDRINGLVATLWRGNDTYTTRVSRLKFAAFVRPLKDRKEYVLHRNDRKLQNSLDNLYAGTAKQNSDDAVRNGCIPVGSASPGSKLSSEDVSSIITSNAKGRDLAVKFGVSEQRICDIRKGRRQEGGTTSEKTDRRFRFLLFNGHVKTLSNWCSLYGLPLNIVSTRLRRKWSVHRALTTPLS